MDFQEKLNLIKEIFSGITEEGENTFAQHGKYYGGIYNNRKFMYSEYMIRNLPIEKLEKFIRSQIS